MLDDDTRYRILKRLEDNPEVNQRELARELGISLGKVNYCLKALIERGFVKVSRFRNSVNKKAYLYHLTPQGMQDRTRMAIRFLQHKRAEYEALERELQVLEQEVRQRAEEANR
ncbi:MAG TPA: MarR family EPS-associated transcriptional regulator [Gammaproteobacteria bacterium]|nr:MarR family EPS-associated transcriptional regulator [Gammaproteobacteria bacterium]